LLQHRRFRAAYDLLVLRTELGEVPLELADWWTRIQSLSPEEQHREFNGGRGGGRGSERQPPAEQAV
jgi:poly(A) polymerase